MTCSEKDKKEVDLLKLTEKEKELKIKELRKKVNTIKKQNDIYRAEMSKLSSKVINEYNLEWELKVLTHNFQKNDIILLNTNEVAEIQKLIGTHLYKVFVHENNFRGGIGTIRTINNSEILCHITDLDLTKIKKLDFKQKGLRRINYL